MKTSNRIVIRCCDGMEERKLLDAAAGMGLSVNSRKRGDHGRDREYSLSTTVYIFDQEKKELSFIGQSFIYSAILSCDERSFSADEFLKIRESGMGFQESFIPVFHVPHDGWKFPAELMKSVCVSQEEFVAYHEKMRDSYVALMVPPCYRTRAQTVEFEVSRLLCDVERLDGSKEVMERYGMGICYEKAFDGVRIKEITEELRKNTAVFYREHHHRMNRICMENRRTVLFDLHSFSDEITPVDFLEAGRKTPDLCIGTADTFTPACLTDIVRTRFEEAGFSTAVNYPYRGCCVPECLSTEESTSSCIPVMLEFNKRSYIKENGFLDDEKVLKIRQVIRDIVSECAVREKHTAF